MLARRAIGRVEQMSQAAKGEQPGFDVATVILNADAAKVYATAVGMLRKSQVVHIVAEDAARRTVEFSNGQRSAGITVTDLGTRLSQLLVGSARLPGRLRHQSCRGWSDARLPGDEGDVQPAVSVTAGVQRPWHFEPSEAMSNPRCNAWRLPRLPRGVRCSQVRPNRRCGRQSQSHYFRCLA